MSRKFGEADIREAAMAICAESCAHMGEPPCYSIKNEAGEYFAWPPETCDDPGCLWLAKAALDAVTHDG